MLIDGSPVPLALEGQHSAHSDALLYQPKKAKCPAIKGLIILSLAVPFEPKIVCSH